MKRVIQLGEDPKRVFFVGGMGVDGIKKISLLKKFELEQSIGFNFGEKNLLVTYHPVTLENNSTEMRYSMVDAWERLPSKCWFKFDDRDVAKAALKQKIDS